MVRRAADCEHGVALVFMIPASVEPQTLRTWPCAKTPFCELRPQRRFATWSHENSDCCRLPLVTYSATPCSHTLCFLNIAAYHHMSAPARFLRVYSHDVHLEPSSTPNLIFLPKPCQFLSRPDSTDLGSPSPDCESGGQLRRREPCMLNFKPAPTGGS